MRHKILIIWYSRLDADIDFSKILVKVTKNGLTQTCLFFFDEAFVTKARLGIRH